MGSTSVVVRVVADTEDEAEAEGPWRSPMVSDRVRCVSFSDLLSGAAIEWSILIRFSARKGYCLLYIMNLRCLQPCHFVPHNEVKLSLGVG